MKSVVLAFLLLLTGCAETRFYEGGQLVAVTQADAQNITIKTARGSSFHADVLNHSVPTTAAYGGATQLVGGVGAAVVAGLVAKP